jgi:phospholipid/cholesterol/gamma-HCH transport system substrate-binding protein
VIGLRRRAAAVALALVTLVAAGGCGFHGIFSLPLPGAVGNGSDTYQVRIQFADVLDLLPYSACKVNGATVGHVASVTLQDGHALVVCQLLDSVHLPRNAVARISETSLLGERYVELEAPRGEPAAGHLVNGDLISLHSTDTDVTVEEVLGALSSLLNGGGLAQLHTIAHEVNIALDGRTGVARDLLARLRDFAGGLDAQRGDILHALSGLDALARTVRNQESELTRATEVMPGALQVLAQDRAQLTRMLVAVSHLGRVATRVVNASGSQLVSNLHALRPTLAQLAKAGSDIPKTLGILVTYPIADTVEKQYKGDYGNLALTMDLSGQSLATFLKGLQLSTPSATSTTPNRPGSHRGTGRHSLLPKVGKHHIKLPKLPKLPAKKRVKKKLDRSLQQLLGSITERAPGHTIHGLLLGNGS